MERKLKNDTSIRIADTVNNTMGNVFECNVNMSVSLSNGKRSKILQRTQSLLILLLTVTFLVVFTQLKREVRVLEEQMNSMNSNMAILMLRYEKLNRNINRMNHRKLRTTVPKIHDEESISISHKINSIENVKKSEKISNEILSTDENTLTKKRFERSIVMFDNNNVTEVTTISTDNLWNDSRSGRSRREEVRGKQRRKMKRRPKGSRRRLGPLVATFVGAVPEQHVTDTGYIGPWVKRNETRYGFNKFHLVEDKKSIEVTANGLYMISVQIYYFGEKMHYSYWILLSSEGSSITRKVIKCATLSAVSATEASCYTSIILPLRRGDRLHVQQQERNRLIDLREGHSYIQVMLLSSDQQKRRLNT